MRRMRILAGLLLICGAVVLGLYVGLWLMFVGGIVAVIHAVQAIPVDALGIAWGIVRIFFASIAGGLSFWALFIPGLALLNK